MSDLVKIRVIYPSPEADGDTRPSPAPPASFPDGSMNRSGGLSRLAVVLLCVAFVGGAVGAGYMFYGDSEPTSTAPMVAGGPTDPPAREAVAAASPESQPARAVSAEEPGAAKDKTVADADVESVARFETAATTPATEMKPASPLVVPTPKPAKGAPAAVSMPLPVKKPSTTLSAGQSAAPATGPVSRSQLTSAVKGREPVDRLPSRVKIGERGGRKVYYFTELKGLNGETVFHRWEHDGRTVASLRFNVGSDRWRAYSSKTIPAKQRGEWRVVVANAQGNILASAQFVAE